MTSSRFLHYLCLIVVFAITGQSVKKVLLLRHCVRSQFPGLFPDHGASGFNEPSNYSKLPYPSQEEWGVSGVALCTPRGKRIAELLGRSLRHILAEPISAVADEPERCVQTMDSLAKGLNISVGMAKVDTAIFDPVKARVCEDLSDAEKGNSIEEQLALANTTGSYLNKVWNHRIALMTELQHLVGEGVAPSITDIANHIRKGYLMGGMYVASQGMVETFILEAGAGLSVAWGKLDGTKRDELWSKWMPLDILFNRINHGGSHIATRLGGATLWHILSLLEDPSAGSTVMIGHDTNLDALAKLVNLSWQCGPFAPDATPPTGGLLLTKHDDSVYIESVCTRFEGEDVGKAVLGKVYMGDRMVSQLPVSLSSLKAAARDKLDFNCIRQSSIVS
eukprot:TRINITY_DN24458_c0_g1_i1.p1 TRINITY_DN24458_c0_g1~~TRINITY_DN24458_c0_g1_i1.p1  ORF type:complete len:392 (+),score=28.63 TRINITY_DN24458_c0_g1_i1:69-1244(+)